VAYFLGHPVNGNNLFGIVTQPQQSEKETARLALKLSAQRNETGKTTKRIVDLYSAYRQ